MILYLNKVSLPDFVEAIRQAEGELTGFLLRTLEEDYYPEYLKSQYNKPLDYWKAL